MPKKKEILFLTSAATMDVGVLLGGVSELSPRYGWSIHVVGSIDSRKALLRLLDFWNPDGCIVQCALGDRICRSSDFGDRPTIWLDRDPASLPPGALCVMQDARAIGVVAAKELLRHDLATYAFVDRADAPFWSRGRRDAFRDAVALNRRPFSEFRVKGREWTAKLGDFLMSLARPAGVFCANDTVAADVISVAARLGIQLPDEMLVVGVDDVEAYCESLAPTLTSVRPAYAQEGRGAAELLAQRMANPDLKGVVKAFAASEITVRQSTRPVATKGGNVGPALEMIRRRAADGVTVDEVVALMGCSRRTAEMRFRQSVHDSILDEIHGARVDLAKKLIADGYHQIGELHSLCGFDSPATFRRVFKSHMGVSPQEYLASSRAGG